MAPDAPCSCCGSPSPGSRHSAEYASRRKGQCEGAERTHSQKSGALRDPSHPAGTRYPSESQRPPHGVGQPVSLQTAGPPRLGEHQGHPPPPSVVLLQGHPEVGRREFNPALQDGQQWPGVYSSVRGSSQRRQLGKRNSNNGAWATTLSFQPSLPSLEKNVEN